MKPRFEPRNEEFTNLLNKANDLAGKVEKAKAKRSSQPEYSAKEGSEQGYEFRTQSAGKDNVKNQGFSTNNHLIQAEDVQNKGAIMETVMLQQGLPLTIQMHSAQQVHLKTLQVAKVQFSNLLAVIYRSTKTSKSKRVSKCYLAA